MSNPVLRFGGMTEKDIVEEVIGHINMADIARHISSKGGFADLKSEKKKAENCVSLALKSVDGNFSSGGYRCVCVKEDGRIVSLELTYSENISSYTYCE